MKSEDLSAASLLSSAGLRRTPVRFGVLDILAKSHQPLDVPEILAKLPGNTDAVTVYRTLNTFTRKKLVHRIRGENRSWRYALGDLRHRPQHQHPHFICEECGKVECFSDAEIPRSLLKSLDISRLYTISYPEVVLHGLCPRCQ